MNQVSEAGHRVCAVFFGAEGDTYRYVIGSAKVDLREVVGELNAVFHGRGGGKPEMVQGSLSGKKKEEELRGWMKEKVRILYHE